MTIPGMPTVRRPSDPPTRVAAGVAGSQLRDLLTSGIRGLESVPSVQPASATRGATRDVIDPAGSPSIDRFLYRGPAALAAARALVERMARATHPPDPAEVEELHDLLRLASAE